MVEAVAASEGDDRPDDPKANALYRFELGGLSICHMGDVGTPLADAQLAPLRGRVDVLLALAGAGLTIALPDLDDAIAAIDPKVVVPMHHRTPSLKYVVGPVEDFLARRGGDHVVLHDGSMLKLDRARLPEALEIHVLQAACDPQARGGG
jgi:L-ascorbate metabolism protein UlaG (beta-lactamase superfamily)